MLPPRNVPSLQGGPYCTPRSTRTTTPSSANSFSLAKRTKQSNLLRARNFCNKVFSTHSQRGAGPDPFPDFFLTTEFPMTARFTIRRSIRKDPVRFVPASEFRLTSLLRLRTGDGR